MAARDYWEASALRRHLTTRVFNAVLIDRHPTSASAHAHHPLEPLFAALDHDGRHSLILSPEGTRGVGPDAGPFKSGLYHLAKRRPDVELVLVLIDNMKRILPKGELPPVPLLGGLSFGMPMYVGDGEGKTAFLDRARHAINSLRVL